MTTAAVLVLLLSAPPMRADASVDTDVLIYAASPGGVIAAVAAARQGERVALLEPSAHVGGVVAGGLTVSDVGKAETIGGLSREFFDRVLKHYTDTYGPDSQQVSDCRTGYRFEPRVAESVYEQMLAEQPTIRLWKRHRIRSVTTADGRITGLVADDLAAGGQRTFTGSVFIDASYTGDLMAGAGVTCRVGRESREEYGESLAGINRGSEETRGRGDHRIQAFNYRICLTNRADNRVPFPKPEPYDPNLFPGLLNTAVRGNVTRFDDMFRGIQRWRVPNDKIDANVADHPGVNHAYPEGNWTTRAEIEAAQRRYSLSLLYFLQNDPRLPESFRATAREWGLPKDEFADNRHFPNHIYVREARRMIGRYVLRQQDVTEERHKADGICLGSYGIDCHSAQRLLGRNGWLNEGGIASPTRPYEIPYRCLTPHSPTNLLVTVCVSATHVAYGTVRMEPVYMMMGHAAGLAAHLARAADSSVQEIDVELLRAILREQGQLLDAPFEPRVDFAWQPAEPAQGQPVTFELRELDVRDPLARFWWDFDGDGTVDSEQRDPVHAFPLAKAHTVSLLAEDETGARTRIQSRPVGIGGSTAGDVSLDDADEGTTSTSGWQKSTAISPYVGSVYFHDQNADKGTRAARFRPDLPRAGRYLVCLAYTANSNRASDVPVTIRHRHGETTVHVDQRVKETVFPFVPLGEYEFDAGPESYVYISNAGTDGFVVYDAARWVWLGP